MRSSVHSFSHVHTMSLPWSEAQSLGSPLRDLGQVGSAASYVWGRMGAGAHPQFFFLFTSPRASTCTLHSLRLATQRAAVTSVGRSRAMRNKPEKRDKVSSQALPCSSDALPGSPLDLFSRFYS